jgi:hypothetical protein
MVGVQGGISQPGRVLLRLTRIEPCKQLLPHCVPVASGDPFVANGNSVPDQGGQMVPPHPSARMVLPPFPVRVLNRVQDLQNLYPLLPKPPVIQALGGFREVGIGEEGLHWSCLRCGSQKYGVMARRLSISLSGEPAQIALRQLARVDPK